ncbi:MAG TPA: tripartite tricarboxylate transporter substrate binding protein [Candidatus Sulfotelmatobacter sp.]|nr:tripartite tricarboxylate transporter substrate binding protein [Candidatus Sulfotelmatobacter sp.]
MTMMIGRIAGALLVLLASAPIAAAAWPERAVRWIVAYPPGAGTDIVARLLGQRLTERLGQPVVVENKPGAGGAIGLEAIATAAPDGYTIGMADTGPLAINPSLYRKLAYDPVASFEPISLIANLPFVLVVHPDLPVHSVAELIALAKAKPGQINYASVGNGSSVHLATELFKTMAGVDLVHVAYKGSAPALHDLLAGQVQVMFVNLLSSLPSIQAGKLRLLAVSPATRLANLPDVPTVAEAGVPGYAYESWFGMVAPAHTPKDVIRRLNTEVVATLAEPDIRTRLIEQGGVEPIGSTPDAFAETIRTDLARYADLVKRTSAHVD